MDLITIRAHKDDTEVFELITVSPKSGRISVWAIIMNDFISDADVKMAVNIIASLKAGQEFNCELVIKDS